MCGVVTSLSSFPVSTPGDPAMSPRSMCLRTKCTCGCARMLVGTHYLQHFEEAHILMPHGRVSVC